MQSQRKLFLQILNNFCNNFHLNTCFIHETWKEFGLWNMLAMHMIYSKVQLKFKYSRGSNYRDLPENVEKETETGLHCCVLLWLQGIMRENTERKHKTEVEEWKGTADVNEEQHRREKGEKKRSLHHMGFIWFRFCFFSFFFSYFSLFLQFPQLHWVRMCVQAKGGRGWVCTGYVCVWVAL